MTTSRRSRQANPEAQLLFPPSVADDFWDHESILRACRDRHIGHLIKAYRHHPAHGPKPFSQELVGNWFRLTQTQLSKIEGRRYAAHQNCRCWSQSRSVSYGNSSTCRSGQRRLLTPRSLIGQPLPMNTAVPIGWRPPSRFW